MNFKNASLSPVLFLAVAIGAGGAICGIALAYLKAFLAKREGANFPD